jgi:hypothetical protein
MRLTNHFINVLGLSVEPRIATTLKPLLVVVREQLLRLLRRQVQAPPLEREYQHETPDILLSQIKDQTTIPFPVRAVRFHPPQYHPKALVLDKEDRLQPLSPLRKIEISC